MHPITGDGHYKYTAPDGTILASKKEAEVLGKEAKKSERRGQPTSRGGD